MSLLAVQGLRVFHGDAETVAGVSFKLEVGEALALVGESGSGKSQTALAIMGLLPTLARVEGSVRFEARELLGAPRATLDSIRGGPMAMVFQDPMSALNPYLRVGAQLAEVPMRHRGLGRDAALAEAARMLDAVRIADPRGRLAQYPHEFSGGMRQRLMIAMALLGAPRLLIADEPTTALDVTVQAEVLELLDELRREHGLALLLITHDLALVAERCERLAVMYSGRIVERGATAELLAAPAHPYTRALLACRPSLEGPRPARLASIEGAAPNPRARLSGCAFAPRCPRAETRCHEVAPTESGDGSGRAVACHFPGAPAAGRCTSPIRFETTAPNP